MKKLLTFLIGITTLTSVYSADFTSFQLASTTLTNGNVLQTNGRNNRWVATSTLGFLPLASSTLYVPYTGATGNIDLGSFGITTTGYLNATSSRFLNASTTNLSASGFSVTNSNTTGIATILNASTTNLSASGITGGNGIFTGLLNVVGKTTLSNASGTSMSLSGNLYNTATTTFQDLYLKGAHYDSVNAIGSLGQVLQASGTSTIWVSTSSLNILASVSGGTQGKAATWGSATTLTTGTLFDNGTVSGVNATTSTSTFNIQGVNSATNPFAVASSTGTNLLILNSSGNLNVGTASTTSISGSGLNFTNAYHGGTLDVVGKTTLALASSTSFSASIGAFLAALYVSGNSTLNGTLGVTGNTTIVNGSSTVFTAPTLYTTNASSTNISGTGMNYTNAFISALTATNASTTNLSVATDFYNGTMTSGSVLFAGTAGKLSQNNSNFFYDNTNFRLGVATSVPQFAFVVATGTIVGNENKLATTTSITVDWKAGNQQLVRTSTSTVTITFVNGTTTPGATLRLVVCNAASGTAGALTFVQVYWPSATMPTQTTTANNCDVWSFISTQSTSTTVIYGNQSAKF